MGDRYQDPQIIGQGGMAKVYRADDTEMGRSVAIKELSDSAARSERNLVKFVAEGCKMASINHPNVVQIFDIEDDGEAPPRLIMELAEGTWADHLQAGPVDVPLVQRVARQVLQGLEAVHQAGFVHRDVKPANLLYFDNGLFKIGDFGIATGDDEQTQVLATPKYMAPETLTRPHLVGPPSDLYSLGLTLYEALVGSERFEDPVRRTVQLDNGDARHVWQAFHGGPEILPSVLELRPEVPEAFSRWLDRLLCKEPDDRFQTCREALVTLERSLSESSTPFDGFVAFEPGQSAGVEATQRIEPTRRKGLSTLQLVLLALVIGVMLGGALLILSGPSRLPLKLSTTPAGAVVLFEGRDVGRTPFAEKVRPGTRLELSLQGFESQTVAVPEDAEGSDNAPLRLHFEMIWSEPVSVTSEPAGAQVVLVGGIESHKDRPQVEDLGTTPVDFKGNGPSQKVRLRLDGYDEETLTLKPGQDPETVILRPSLPEISTLTTPSSLVQALEPFLSSEAVVDLELWGEPRGESGPVDRLLFGDRLRLRVRSDVDGHGVLFMLQSQGDVLLLYPSPRGGAVQLRAGMALDLPRPSHVDAGYRLVASEPAGMDYAFLLLSESPLPGLPKGQILGSWSRFFPFGDGGEASAAASWVRWVAEQVRKQSGKQRTAWLIRLEVPVEPGSGGRR